MERPRAQFLSNGTRLHLQHGPIDLIIGADGDRERAFGSARARFATVLEELVAELPDLKAPMNRHVAVPRGSVASRMDRAVRPYADMFVTRMAAVAGAVADEVMNAMQKAATLRRAYVNNGGDIALHLTEGTEFKVAIQGLRGEPLGQISIAANDGVGGIATSGRRGRSLSFGIADSVTVLATTAAEADAAATLIGNAVDLPGHPAIRRLPAHELSPDSDLLDRMVTVSCGALSRFEAERALRPAQDLAKHMLSQSNIHGAALFCQAASAVVGAVPLVSPSPKTMVNAF